MTDTEYLSITREKTIMRMKHIIWILALISAVSGCSSEPLKEQPKTVAEPTQPEKITSKAVEYKPELQALQKTTIAVDPLNNPKSVLTAKTIYYDYDSSNIQSEYQSLIQAHAKYLIGHRTTKIRIEGNCDERGSREYNLALGQRRAEVVKNAMRTVGVADDQMETVSWGEEKPKVDGHSENAWSKNRRSDIVYTQTR
jgi:peptidoglycan-associated lipoprotein